MHRLPQVVRFLLLGGLAAGINWVTRFPLSLVMPFPAAVLVAQFIGICAGFTLYRSYVFPGSNRSFVEQTMTFLLVNLVGSGVVLVVATTMLSLLEATAWPDFVREGLAHGLAICVGAVINFFGHKFLTFRVSISG